MSKFKSVNPLMAVGLGVASLGGGAVPATAASPSQYTSSPYGSSQYTSSQVTPWTGWLSGTTSDTTATLKQVRTLIGADTGTAATLTGKGVGVALIDTGVAPVAGLPAASV